MNLSVLGCNYQSAPVEIREKLSLSEAVHRQHLEELSARFDSEVLLLSTCNRVEYYLARPPGTSSWEKELFAEFLCEYHTLQPRELLPVLYQHENEQAIKHLFRVAASLDSLVVGEGQIAGQVKAAFEWAQSIGTTSLMLNTLLPHALRTAKRVRTETGIALGHVSVSSVAVDYVKQIFDYFQDKTVLLIGAGKMARLTLQHLIDLKPKQILVTNRSTEKAHQTAARCGGRVVAWENLNDALATADIVISTTGSSEPIMTVDRYEQEVAPKRNRSTLVVIDIAVPRDFDPMIHNGDSVFIFNIDDLSRIREQMIAERQRHIKPAELIIQQEVDKFLQDWERRKHAPVIQMLRSEVDKVRSEVVNPLLNKFNGKLSPSEKESIEAAFRLFQNRLLHGPIAALQDASKEGKSSTLLDALKKLFRLE